MKKILILQINNVTTGGVYYVNKSLSESFIKNNYKVKVISIRESYDNKIELEFDDFSVISRNTWDFVRKREIFNNLIKFNIGYSIKLIYKYIKGRFSLFRDYQKMKKEIRNYEPDYIIVSHYECFPGIPKEYIGKCINIHHSSFKILYDFRDNLKILKNYNNKIKYVWLTEASKAEAIKNGFKNNYCIYNPIKFECNDKADVINNKRIILISRLSKEKRIGVMIDIVRDVFKNKLYKDWVFDIYGYGDDYINIKNMVDGKRIRYMGNTNMVKEELLKSSLTLNTSLFEGFSLSIIEGYECGIPVISYNFGESISEEVIENNTGYIIDMDNVNMFKEKLIFLLDNPLELDRLSCGAKEFAKNFNIDNISDKWFSLFRDIDEKR